MVRRLLTRVRKWLVDRELRRAADRCARGEHDTYIVYPGVNKNWTVEDRELHCRRCGFLRYLPPKFNYD